MIEKRKSFSSCYDFSEETHIGYLLHLLMEHLGTVNSLFVLFQREMHYSAWLNFI
jgi:hypothetical protein